MNKPTQQVEPSNAEIRKWLETHDGTFGTRKEIALLVLDRLEAAERDAAFYRCCALSGEVPKGGSEPSAAASDK